jgi:signal transduction histidine kinase
MKRLAALLPGDAWDSLTEAALCTERDFSAVKLDAVSPAEVSALTAALVDRLRHSASTASGPPPSVPISPLARRLLGLLRANFIRQAGSLETAPDVGRVLAILAAMEECAAELEPTWDVRFGERLTGPNGLDLVVEVAHDLRSPLTSILFLAETLLRGRSGPISALQERQLGLIYSAAFGLSAVTSDMVELVRGRGQMTDPEPMPFSITEIMESVRDIVRPIAEEKGLEVRLVLPERPFRMGFPVAINRVLLNLTTNALKFTEEGYVEIAAVTGGQDQAVEFTVRDTGRGIPPQAMELLFEPFRRRRRDHEYAFSGSGLGLSICRKFVEAMGSELSVETELGKGTRFAFALPLPEPTFGETAEVEHVAAR